METNKNQTSIITEKGIKKALEAFKSSYEQNKEKYEEKGIKVEDVVSLTESFSGKNASLATNVILSVMMAMPPKDFMVLMETAKVLSKVKFLESMKEILEKKIKDTYNYINN